MKSSLSFSEYSLALDCLQKYKYLVVDKIKIPGELSGELLFGSAMHAAIHTYLSGDDGRDVFEVYWGGYRDKQVSFQRHGYEDLHGLGHEFLRKFAKYKLKKFKPLLMEKRLYANYMGLDFEGTPDFIGEYEGSIVLLDWKTTAYAYPKEKLLTSLQLVLYLYLVVKSTDLRPTHVGYMNFVKNTGGIQGPMLKELTQAEMYARMDDMVDYYKKLSATDSYPRNAAACVKGTIKCAFIDRCFGGKND